jgi:hypothetical protein
MNNATRRAALAAGALTLTAALYAPLVHSQVDKGLVGAWSLVTNTNTDSAGKTANMYGDKPMGQAIFTAGGRYAVVITRPDLPKFASNNRLKGTDAENKGIVGGMIAHYGRYTVDPKTKAITFHIEASSFPNWNGTSQDRPYSLKGNELKWKTPVSSGGGVSDLVWKRAG